jgi:hypothetical protein
MKKILPDNHIRHLPQNQQYDNDVIGGHGDACPRVPFRVLGY